MKLNLHEIAGVRTRCYYVWFCEITTACAIRDEHWEGKRISRKKILLLSKDPDIEIANNNRKQRSKDSWFLRQYFKFPTSIIRGYSNSLTSIFLLDHRKISNWYKTYIFNSIYLFPNRFNAGTLIPQTHNEPLSYVGMISRPSSSCEKTRLSTSIESVEEQLNLIPKARERTALQKSEKSKIHLFTYLFTKAECPNLISKRVQWTKSTVLHAFYLARLSRIVEEWTEFVEESPKSQRFILYHSEEIYRKKFQVQIDKAVSFQFVYIRVKDFIQSSRAKSERTAAKEFVVFLESNPSIGIRRDASNSFIQSDLDAATRDVQRWLIKYSFERRKTGCNI